MLVSTVFGSKICMKDPESRSPLLRKRRSLKVSNSSPGCRVVRKLGRCRRLRMSPMRPAPRSSLARINMYFVFSYSSVSRRLIFLKEVFLAFAGITCASTGMIVSLKASIAASGTSSAQSSCPWLCMSS